MSDEWSRVAIGDARARAGALVAEVTDLSRLVYELRWKVEDEGRAAQMSEELWEYRERHLGIAGLEDALVDLARQLGAAIDFTFPTDPPEWWERRQAQRRAWRDDSAN